MHKKIKVKPSKGLMWLQVVATSKERLECLVRASEDICMEWGAKCQAAAGGEEYEVLELRAGIYYTTVPCPSEHRDQIRAMEESPFRLNRQQAFVAGVETYFDRHPYLNERDANTNAIVCHAGDSKKVALEPPPPRPINVIVQVYKEDKDLIQQIAEDLCKAKDI